MVSANPGHKRLPAPITNEARKPLKQPPLRDLTRELTPSETEAGPIVTGVGETTLSHYLKS